MLLYFFFQKNNQLKIYNYFMNMTEENIIQEFRLTKIKRGTMKSIVSKKLFTLHKKINFYFLLPKESYIDVTYLVMCKLIKTF